MTRFRYSAIGGNAQFACNSDANLVNREASLYFLKLVLFRPYLASAEVLFCRPLKNITMFGPRPMAIVSSNFNSNNNKIIIITIFI